jgi:DNA-binding response OmpR family regulator
MLTHLRRKSQSGEEVTQFKRVLIVEDEPVLRSVIARNLAAHGCEVREAATVAEAIEELSGETDLILLDINLPDRTGWDVLRHLKRDGRTVPTVIVSAVRVSPERLAEFQPLAYLPKPFPIEALLRIIEGDTEADQAFITATSPQAQEEQFG